MKNGSHPLIQALRRKNGPAEQPFQMDAPDRLFQIKKEDIPPGKTFDAGDNAKFAIHGKIRSTHDDGSLMMAVHKVEHQSDSQDATEAPREPITTTQKSHTP